MEEIFAILMILSFLFFSIVIKIIVTSIVNVVKKYLKSCNLMKRKVEERDEIFWNNER